MIEVNLTEKQKQILRDTHNTRYGNICLYGGGGSGKTFFLVRHLLIRAMLAPNSFHLIIRKAFNHAKGPIINDILERVLLQSDEFPGLATDKDFNINRTDGTISLPNGSKIYIKGLDRHKVGNLLGTQYTTVYLNECSELDYSSIQELIARIRIDVKVLDQKNEFVTTMRAQRLFDFNPPLKTHWTYKLFKELKDPITGRDLPNAHDYYICHSTPRDNIANLSQDYINNLQYAGGDICKRFLDGEFQDAIKGALFTHGMIQKANNCEFRNLSRDEVRQKMDYVCIGVDPAVTSTDESDLTGIVVCGYDGNNMYVLEDASGKYAPEEWAMVIARLYSSWRANTVVVETNQGGDLLKENIKSFGGRDIYIQGVRARDGKRIRAEPIATLYSRNKVYHVQYYTENRNKEDFGNTSDHKDGDIVNGLIDLENEMLSFTGNTREKSPDRLDALVHGLQYIMDNQENYMNAKEGTFLFNI